MEIILESIKKVPNRSMVPGSFSCLFPVSLINIVLRLPVARSSNGDWGGKFESITARMTLQGLRHGDIWPKISKHRHA